MLNWSRVAELKEDLGEEDFREITTLFLEEVEEKLAELSSDPPDIFADDLHFLKGSAANLGFEGFRAMCEQMENTPDTAQLSDLRGLYALSKTAFLEGMGP
ncbi:Hpt domain-containing protein [Litoreibacter halocynthiae]|uniref:Hpt domain-containing protein n=1 Tax=Litoreibacter halocynthiae TaxID=1242689 RepID=A0A4R7LDQ6_9RHOB|nr:Hpt domain-containing protein [Litoreibacter halocynthiae]TDT73717.1 Hpt domain-containing protein [Litoreibacter halocynthiae]